MCHHLVFVYLFEGNCKISYLLSRYSITCKHFVWNIFYIFAVEIIELLFVLIHSWLWTRWIREFGISRDREIPVRLFEERLQSFQHSKAPDKCHENSFLSGELLMDDSLWNARSINIMCKTKLSLCKNQERILQRNMFRLPMGLVVAFDSSTF